MVLFVSVYKPNARVCPLASCGAKISRENTTVNLRLCFYPIGRFY